MRQYIEEPAAGDQFNGCLSRCALYIILTILVTIFVMGLLAGIGLAAVLQ